MAQLDFNLMDPNQPARIGQAFVGNYQAAQQQGQEQEAALEAKEQELIGSAYFQLASTAPTKENAMRVFGSLQGQVRPEKHQKMMTMLQSTPDQVVPMLVKEAIAKHPEWQKQFIASQFPKEMSQPRQLDPSEVELNRARARAYDREAAQGVGVNGLPTKPMPSTALRLQQDELDELSIASAIQSDIEEARDLLDSGELKLGPFENIKSEARNVAGRSSDVSRNYASFKAMLEKMRNDSLRLNKGVQTEGDAVRAWNEILANINDPALVKQRLVEVERINQRAANLRANNLNVLRQNYNLPPLDVSQYTNQPAAAVGGGRVKSMNEIQGGGKTQSFPPAAVDYLRKNNTPVIRQQFDAKYGQGAANAALGGR